MKIMDKVISYFEIDLSNINLFSGSRDDLEIIKEKMSFKVA